MRNITNLTEKEIAHKKETTKKVKELAKILGVTFIRIYSNFYENGTTTIKFWGANTKNVTILKGVVESLEKNRIKAAITNSPYNKEFMSLIVRL